MVQCMVHCMVHGASHGALTLPSSAVTGSSGSSWVIAHTRCVSDSSTAERRRLLVSTLSTSPTASDAERLPDIFRAARWFWWCTRCGVVLIAVMQ